MMRAVLILGALALAGCAPNTVDPADLKPPSAWMMRPVCALPPIPTDDGDPVARANYNAKVRECAAARGDQARGLQRYARATAQKR
jgi:hypothetical protein